MAVAKSKWELDGWINIDGSLTVLWLNRSNGSMKRDFKKRELQRLLDVGNHSLRQRFK